ncbi:thiamine-phosphate kinase [Lujinxingia litoralis]|uniref:Thiamine-monophosphate kinase n=1 Tax=Lujinxingia litoralis TaxID=2211119 RepID=A0A328CBY7_9DELT|nr:thiamine-phosphate kinase [Lujinxingia litoralis]RAL25186.1 thiamine-phosphate kinase [Lujinxingia litoralis]
MTTEFELIARIAELFGSPEGVAVGIGDDGAVLDPGRFDLVTMDTMVEGVHFRRDWSSPEDVGWKLLASNLSDIAAMGGGPGAFFLSMALPADLDPAWVEGVLSGIRKAADALVPGSFEVSAGGGDLSATHGPIVLTLTLMGEASPAGPVLRRGAVPGDRIVLMGQTGLAAAGLALLSGEMDAPAESFPCALRAHRRPGAQVRAGALLGLYGVPSAMIDVSDGVVQDLGHVLRASEVGARLEAYSLPHHPELVMLREQYGVDILKLMLTGGDDYELLMTIPPSRMPKIWDMARRHSWEVHDIGEIRAPEEGLMVLGADGEVIVFEQGGYRHFGAS